MVINNMIIGVLGILVLTFLYTFHTDRQFKKNPNYEYKGFVNSYIRTGATISLIYVCFEGGLWIGYYLFPYLYMYDNVYLLFILPIFPMIDLSLTYHIFKKISMVEFNPIFTYLMKKFGLKKGSVISYFFILMILAILIYIFRKFGGLSDYLQIFFGFFITYIFVYINNIILLKYRLNKIGVEDD